MVVITAVTSTLNSDSGSFPTIIFCYSVPLCLSAAYSIIFKHVMSLHLSRMAAPVPCKFGSNAVFVSEEARDKVKKKEVFTSKPQRE